MNEATGTATVAKQSAFIISGVHLEKSIRQRKHVDTAHADRETDTEKQSKWELESKRLLSWLVQALVILKHWGSPSMQLESLFLLQPLMHELKIMQA